MRSFEIKVYPELLTGHIMCDHATAWEFIDWVEENQVRLWEPGKVDFNGNPYPWDIGKRRRALRGEKTKWKLPTTLMQPTTTLWFLGHPDEALLLKLRWHDHFSED